MDRGAWWATVHGSQRVCLCSFRYYNRMLNFLEGKWYVYILPDSIENVISKPLFSFLLWYILRWQKFFSSLPTKVMLFPPLWNICLLPFPCFPKVNIFPHVADPVQLVEGKKSIFQHSLSLCLIFCLPRVEGKSQQSDLPEDLCPLGLSVRLKRKVRETGKQTKSKP